MRAQSDMFKSPNKVLVHAVVFVDLVISFRCLNRNGKNKNNKNKNKKERKKEEKKSTAQTHLRVCILKSTRPLPLKTTLLLLQQQAR